MRFERMAQRRRAVDLIMRAPALPVTRDRAGLLEVVKDLEDGALGDADVVGHVADARLGVLRQRDQHVGVIAQVRPAVATRRKLDVRVVSCYFLHEKFFM